MQRLRLTILQRKLFDFLKERRAGVFELDEVIGLLYPVAQATVATGRPVNVRICAASVVQTLANKFDCSCCYIDRISPIGRGHKAVFRFKMICSEG
jgi:hypothetical protein